MDFRDAKKLGVCLSRDYAEGMFRLLVNYRDISSSEAASRLGIHIRTAQDFLDTLSEAGVLLRAEVSEGKRPHFRYALAQRRIDIDIDLESMFGDDASEDRFDRPIRERKGSGAQFSTARSGEHIASVTIWDGRGRDRKSRTINLTTPQGRFLYHLPFPTANALPVSAIMEKAGLGEAHRGEVNDLVDILEQGRVIESR
jgi:ribosomal protein S25